MKSSSAYNAVECQNAADRLVLSEIDHKFSSVRTKCDVIKALENNYLLCRIPIASPVVTMEQAQKDFERERVLLNDVAFIPDVFDENRCHAFSATLSVLLERMMRNKDIYNKEHYESPGEIADAILQRACRTAAGSDSYFKIQQLLCVENTVITQKTFLHDPPIRVDVFVTDYSSAEDSASSSIGSETTGESRTSDEEGRQNGIFSRILVQNSFAIYDSSSIDLFTGDSEIDPIPWLEVEATIVDEVNYRTNEQDRALQLLITCPETGAVYQSASHAPSYFSNSNGSSGGSHSHNSSFHSTPLKPPRAKGVLSEISNFLASASPRRPSASTPTPPPPPPAAASSFGSSSSSLHGIASGGLHSDFVDNSSTSLDD